MRDYSRIAARIFDTPLLTTPEVAAGIADFLFARMTSGELAAPGARSPFSSSAFDDEDAPYEIDDGVATIAIRGELVNRGSWMSALSGLTSYETFGAALTQANADYRVKSILLDIDSPGGEAAGAMEAAAKVRASEKPVVAYVNSLAASAAYALAAGAKEIVTPPSGMVGSIGVVWVHMDRSQAIKDRGMKPTILHAGAYKVDGHSLGPMPDDARARIQAQIDQVYGLFVASVGKHRPKLGEAGARATEAGLYMGDKAVEAGLADRVGTLSDAVAAVRSRTKPLAFAKTKRSLVMANEEPVYTQAALDSAVAAARRETEASAATAVASARTAERDRIKAILDGEPAKGKQALARHFALTTDMSPEAATAALAASPAEAAAEGKRMDRVPAVDIRPSASQRDENPQAEIDATYKGIADKLNRGVPERFRPN